MWPSLGSFEITSEFNVRCTRNIYSFFEINKDAGITHEISHAWHGPDCLGTKKAHNIIYFFKTVGSA